MARESKVETEVRESITGHLAPNESLREFSWGATEGFISARYFVGFTDKRLMLVEVNGTMPTGDVHNISIGDIKGLEYRSSGTYGILKVHLSADILELNFEKRPWWPRAKNMAKLMPLQK